MEPQVQYAKTSDGVSIAYTVTGEGPPLLILPPNHSTQSCQLEWSHPASRHLACAARDAQHI